MSPYIEIVLFFFFYIFWSFWTLRFICIFLRTSKKKRAHNINNVYPVFRCLYKLLQRYMRSQKRHISRVKSVMQVDGFRTGNMFHCALELNTAINTESNVKA